MKYINLVYGDDYEDVDILRVPDEIADNIDNVMRDFFRWTEIPENRQQLLIKNLDGEMVVGIDTEEFLWWLNNVKILDESKATIERQHTTLWQGYPIAEF